MGTAPAASETAGAWAVATPEPAVPFSAAVAHHLDPDLAHPARGEVPAPCGEPRHEAHEKEDPEDQQAPPEGSGVPGMELVHGVSSPRSCARIVEASVSIARASSWFPRDSSAGP
jgi:hypothetical protein